MELFSLTNLSYYKESDQLEAKKAKGGLPSSLWETYSSFCNTDGGVILLGVDEKSDGSLVAVGVDDPYKLVKDIWNTINNSQKVSANLLMDKDVSIEQVDGKSIVRMVVPRADRFSRPVFIGSNPLTGSFRRNGDGDYRCSRDDISAMMRDNANISMDCKVLPSMDMDVFCPESIRSYRTIFETIHSHHPWNNLETSDFLKKIGAMGFDESSHRLCPTAAGLLFFGYDSDITREFPQYFLDFQEIGVGYSRWSDRKVSSSGDWSGNLFDFFYYVYNKLSFDIPKPFELDGPYRVDETIAHKAVRECLLNSLCHADFYGVRGLVIKKTHDSIEISNPGCFRISMEDALGGGMSDPRNATIFKLFSLLDLCERAGMGIPTVISSWNKFFQLSPIIHESHGPDRISVFLPLPSSSDLHCDSILCEESPSLRYGFHTSEKSECPKNPSYSSAGRKRLSVDERKEQVIAFFQKGGVVTCAAIASELGVTTGLIKKYLAELVAEGRIVSMGANKNRTYRLK